MLCVSSITKIPKTKNATMGIAIPSFVLLCFLGNIPATGKEYLKDESA